MSKQYILVFLINFTKKKYWCWDAPVTNIWKTPVLMLTTDITNIYMHPLHKHTPTFPFWYGTSWNLSRDFSLVVSVRWGVISVETFLVSWKIQWFLLKLFTFINLHKISKIPSYLFVHSSSWEIMPTIIFSLVLFSLRFFYRDSLHSSVCVILLLPKINIALIYIYI